MTKAPWWWKGNPALAHELVGEEATVLLPKNYSVTLPPLPDYSVPTPPQQAPDYSTATISHSAILASTAADWHDDYWSKRLPKTQKARGVLFGRMIGHTKWGVSAYIQAGNDDITVFPGKNFKMPISWPQFARPCPVRPRHGFVESRQVNSISDVMKVLNETLLEERDAEMILMPKLSGKYSAVATNAGVVWGWGNDGATSRAGGVLIPAAVPSSDWTTHILRQHHSASEYERAKHLAEGLISDTAYLELVENDAHTYIVQVRDGPEQKAARNWIPDRRTAGVVLTPEPGDTLLTWESKVKNFAASHTVVNLPGHTLSDHYAVHAIAAGVPVITDRHVTLGETIEPEEDVAVWTDEDYQKLAGLVREWSEADYFPNHFAGQRNRFMTAVGSLHAMGIWKPEPHLMNMMANAVVSLLRASASATVGEMRHWFVHGPGSEYDEDDDEQIPGETPPPGNYPFGPGFWFGQETGKTMVHGRDHYYREFLKPWALLDLEQLHNALAEDFDARGWDYSYGGKAWSNVARTGQSLAAALHVFITSEHPNAELWGAVVSAANAFVHTSHNNGVALNKWLTGLDDFAVAPQLAWLNPYAAELALNQGKEISDAAAKSTYINTADELASLGL